MNKPKISMVKVKRTTHPNEEKYHGKSSYDYNLALIRVTQNMTEEEKNRFIDLEGIVNPEKLQKFMDEVKIGDVVGIDVELYIVDFKTEKGLICSGYNKRFTNHLIENKEIDTALAIGYCEILYRDKKPYGISETMNVKIVDYSDQTTNQEEKKENS